MVFFKAEKLQRLARLLQQVQKAIEEAGGDLPDSEERLDEVARGAGLDLELARAADAPTLEMVLAGGGGAGGRCWLAAEVLFLDGLLAAARGREAETRDRLEKARRLYRLVGPDLELPEDAPAPPDERLRRIEALLE